ncbi:uncharacterized protein ZK1073.1-like isoform X2 [Mercenaria mercenaria]|uniref:uncharacterized protein ZK1073.1-like isoform X2 n=1 Tax=Mercenaria mercenaria TaxID=6596 RepID=UPI00234F99D0|nr:uncharacterized protein ZK1073.1-like isoform X2 [Mercenaria mercenaria]
MSSANLEHREVSAPRVSKFNVYIQGDLKHCHFTILTVHDLGCNHNSWRNFLEHESMKHITNRAAFIHVDVPGQEDGAPDLPPEEESTSAISNIGRRLSMGTERKGSFREQTEECYTFPSMQSLGEDLVCVLDQLDVKNVVGLGEGAGANIIARFAMSHPKRVLGICLVHCTGTTAGFMESLKDKVIGWKLDHIGMNPTAEAYLVLHRFGSSSMTFEKAENKEELNKVLTTFQDGLRSKLNPHNLNRYVQSFMKRTCITDTIQKITCPVLMVTGDKASFNHTVHHLYGYMSQKLDKAKIELLEVEGVANVLEEKPQKLAESFLYFCQGIGVVGGVPMPRVERTSSVDSDSARAALRNRSMSMEEADLPKGTYSTSPTRPSGTKIEGTVSASEVKVDLVEKE